MRMFFTNLGCKLNQAEVDALKRRFVAAGHRLSPSLAEADCHVVNSCTVTHLAARDSRKVARRGRRVNPAMRTVLTGCYATEQPGEAARIAGVDLVVANDDKDRLVERVHEAFPDVVPAATEAGLAIPYVPLEMGLARALVKVEDGCNMRCSFCIIPATRGRQRSRPVSEAVADVQALADGGYQEVVITGVQISEYRDGEARLYDLVNALLEQTTVPRLRVTSIAPWRFDERLLDLWRAHQPRLCRHMHLSLQSGCTATLRRMRRPYRAEQYADLVARIRAAVPEMAITTDVIVGFPGETDEEFAESLAFVESMAFAKPHIFTFSPRAGTHAEGLPDPVSPQVKKARVHAMIEIAQASGRAFLQQQVGTRAHVVWEDERRGRMTGMTDHYARVFRDGEVDPAQVAALQGQIEEVRLDRVDGDALIASTVGDATVVSPGAQRASGLHVIG